MITYEIVKTVRDGHRYTPELVLRAANLQRVNEEYRRLRTEHPDWHLHISAVSPLDTENDVAVDTVAQNALDAVRYRVLRGDGETQTAYAPEEAGVWGGEALDALCDALIVENKKDAK